MFVPLYWNWGYLVSTEGTDEAQLMEWFDLFDAHITELTATLDGRPLRNLYAYRATSSLFKWWWVDDNAFFMDPMSEPVDAIADGFCLMLAPLHVGHHEIRWTWTSMWTLEEDGFDFIQTQAITYYIPVTPR